MKTYDISLPISPTLPVWPGDPRVALPRVSKIEDGAVANVTRMDMGAHTGTHVDAPFHFIHNGSTTESLDINILTGPALVVALEDVNIITASDLLAANLPEGVTRVLFKTRNSRHWANPVHTEFDVNYVSLAEDASRLLVEKGVKLVGVDYLSVAPYEEVIGTHVTLLSARVIIVEGLDLSAVPPGEYQFYCLPLKLVGADGAPARAILVSE